MSKLADKINKEDKLIHKINKKMSNIMYQHSPIFGNTFTLQLTKPEFEVIKTRVKVVNRTFSCSGNIWKIIV